MRHILACFAALAAFVALMARGGAVLAEPLAPLPHPPPLPASLLEGHVAHDGALIWFATYGEGPPVIVLHGAGGDSGNLGFQVPALVADHHRVISIDSRGQGRSTMGPGALSYERMESDVVAVMDQLGLRKASFVGWSDGGIVSLVLAMKHPDRADRIFAFGANMDLKGLNPKWADDPMVAAILAQAQADYAQISPPPHDFGAMMGQVETMLNTQPNYTAAQLRSIHGPAIAIADGADETLILPEHARYLARTIPHARLILLPGVGHFAPVQTPDAFNAAMIGFLDGRR